MAHVFASTAARSPITDPPTAVATPQPIPAAVELPTHRDNAPHLRQRRIAVHLQSSRLLRAASPTTVSPNPRPPDSPSATAVRLHSNRPTAAADHVSHPHVLPGTPDRSPAAAPQLHPSPKHPATRANLCRRAAPATVTGRSPTPALAAP